jgi:hypothetical protein
MVTLFLILHWYCCYGVDIKMLSITNFIFCNFVSDFNSSDRLKNDWGNWTLVTDRSRTGYFG